MELRRGNEVELAERRRGSETDRIALTDNLRRRGREEPVKRKGGVNVLNLALERSTAVKARETRVLEKRDARGSQEQCNRHAVREREASGGREEDDSRVATRRFRSKVSYRYASVVMERFRRFLSCPILPAMTAVHSASSQRSKVRLRVVKFEQFCTSSCT